MEITDELRDLGTGNGVAWFTTVDDRLAAVRQLLDVYGRDYAQDLDQRVGDGPATTVATGDQLIKRLERQALKQGARP